MSAAVSIQPPSVLLMGAAGAGKTWAVTTFAEAGVEVFVLGTEPNAADSLLDSAKQRGIPVEKLHFHAVTPAPADWDALEASAREVSTKSFEQIAIAKVNPGRATMTHWLEFLKACRNFPDDLSGREFGDVTRWNADRVLVVDSLSGLNVMARQYTVGLRTSMAKGEWGTAMELEGQLLRKLVSDRGSFFVLIAHLDRNVDEVSQSTKLMPAALGNKLAPQLAPLFSEVVLARKNTSATGSVAWDWATSDKLADLKNRALAASTSLQPTFRPLVEAHRRRLGETAKTPPLGSVPPSAPVG